jgi:L-seryl-tRNA(Ser) seleniumtransferase
MEHTQYYQALGAKRIINCFDTYTLLGGSILPKEVREAMLEANRSHAWLWDLAEKAGKKVAELTGAESALVTPGAFAAMAMSAAACMAGRDPARMRQLPNTSGMKNEFIIQRGLRDFQYDRSLTVAGGRLIEVGDERSGCTPEQIIAAINDKTAAIHCFAHGTTGTFASKECRFVPVEEVMKIGRQHDLPVLVDAAFQCYPLEGFTKYAAMGADAVAYSCKYFGGPNTAGLLLGSKTLIESVSFHSFMGQEGGPRGRELLSEAERGFYSSVFRGYKQDRSSVVGAVVALERYMNLMKDPEKALQPARKKLNYLFEALSPVPGVELIVIDSRSRVDPLQIGLQIRLLKKTAEQTAEIVDDLMNGDPEIWPGRDGNRLLINATSFRGLELFCDGDEKIIAERLVDILAG